MIDDDNFAEGFRQGFRAIRGSAAAMPPMPPQPATIAERTPFQMGLMRGVERGKGWERGDLVRKNRLS
jgi:hypothetical protein